MQLCCSLLAAGDFLGLFLVEPYQRAPGLASMAFTGRAELDAQTTNLPSAPLPPALQVHILQIIECLAHADQGRLAPRSASAQPRTR